MLGLCSPAEREQIEGELFEDEDAFEEMLTAEDDLIDTYARGELTAEERRRFEASFASSLRGRGRVQFARAFAGAVSARNSVEPKPSGSLLDIFRIFQWPRVLWTTIAVSIVLLAVLASLLIDRRRMTAELRELRAQSAELSKRTEALQQSSDIERTRTGEIAAELADLRAQPDNSKHREHGNTANQRERYVPKVQNNRRTMASSKPEQPQTPETPVDASLSNAPLGDRFEAVKITQLPLNVRDVANLLSLQPAVTPSGSLEADPAYSASIMMDGANEPIRTFFLMLPNAGRIRENVIGIPSSFSWIRFAIALERAPIHEDYRVTIKTADGHPVTSVDWIEPFTPNQTTIDTPAISTRDLPSGNYMLLLMGKEPGGSFVKIAEYSFQFTKYE